MADNTMAFTPELILGIIGTITGILSLIISIFFTRKALQQADKNLKTQLLYADKKQALMKLQKIIDETKYIELRQKIIDFSNSFEGNYIPYDVLSKIYDKLNEIENFEDENAYYPTKRKMDEEAAESEEQDDERMTNEEIFDHEFEFKIESFKHSAKSYINESLTELRPQSGQHVKLWFTVKVIYCKWLSLLKNRLAKIRGRATVLLCCRIRRSNYSLPLF